MLREFVRETYGDELEFLWTQFPDNAVWRRKDNRKWYGAILTVEGRKLGLESERIEEIVDLRMDPKEAEEILSRANYKFPQHLRLLCPENRRFVTLSGHIADDLTDCRPDSAHVCARSIRLIKHVFSARLFLN